MLNEALSVIFKHRAFSQKSKLNLHSKNSFGEEFSQANCKEEESFQKFFSARGFVSIRKVRI